MIKKIIIGIFFLAIVGGVGIKGKLLLEERKAEIDDTTIPQKMVQSVSVITAKHGEIKEIKSYLAQIAFDKSIKVSTKMAGYIKKVYVNEGDRVKKGSLLAKIDAEDIDSNIALLRTTMEQQKNDLALAEQIYNRNLKLYDIGGLAKEQVDISKVVMEGKESIIKVSRQKISQLQEQKKYLNIKAPFNGIIDTVILYGGDLAVAGKPILTMSSGVKKLLFNYTLHQNQIKKTQKVFYKGEKIGEIKLIKNIAKSGLIQAEVSLNKSLKIPIGSSINIDVLIKRARGCIIPNKTLLHKKDGLYIMVYKDRKFKSLKVNKILDNSRETIISSCPKEKIAIGNETMLSQLTIYNKIEIR